MADQGMGQGLAVAAPFAVVVPSFDEELREDARRIRVSFTYVWGPFTKREQATAFARFVTTEIDPAIVEPYWQALTRTGIRHRDPIDELLTWRTHALEAVAGGHALAYPEQPQPEPGPTIHLPTVMFAPCGRTQQHSTHRWNDGREWTCSGRGEPAREERGSLALDNDDAVDPYGSQPIDLRHPLSPGVHEFVWPDDWPTLAYRPMHSPEEWAAFLAEWGGAL